MINFYDPSVIDIRKKSLKKHRILFYLVLSITLISEAILCFFIEYKNKNIIQPIMIALGMIFAALLVFIYIYFLYPDKWKIKRYTLMNDSIKHQHIGVVESIKEDSTLRRDIIGKEMVFTVSDGSVVLLLEDGDAVFDFVIGNKYKISTYDNFIVTAEEIKDE